MSVACIFIFAVASLLGYLKAEDCFLNQRNSLHPWVVSLRYIKRPDALMGVGNLISKSFVLSPMTPYLNRFRVFINGYEVNAISGERDKPGSCRQNRRGKKVMGHPNFPEDRYTFNFAILEVEHFNVDPLAPFVIPFLKTEGGNVETLTKFTEVGAQCQVVIYKTKYLSIDNYDNEAEAHNVEMLPRYVCWNTYCPSGRRSCMAYFVESELFFCSKPFVEKTCKEQDIGAPLICNGLVLGMLKTCRNGKPLIFQGFNSNLLKAIEMYQDISGGIDKVEDSTEEQDDTPAVQFDVNGDPVEYEERTEASLNTTMKVTKTDFFPKF